MNESIEKVLYVTIVFIIPKMRNQHVLPAKNGPLEYMEHTIYDLHVYMVQDMQILVYCVFLPFYGPSKNHAYGWSRFILIYGLQQGCTQYKVLTM